MNNPNLNIQNVNEDEMREVGRKIKEARKGMHITQERMSEETGLTEKTIRDIENGKKCPSYDTIVIISSYLRLSPDSFFPERLTARCRCEDQELAAIVSGIEQMEKEQKEAVKSFLKVYMAGITQMNFRNR